jgi:hypothetical protein
MRTPIALSLLVIATACGKGTGDAKDDSAKANPASAAPAGALPPTVAAATPAVRIISPAENDSTGADVTVVLGKENVTIAKADSKKTEGTGHYHLFLDTIPSPDGAPIPPTSAKIIHIGTGDSTFTFKGLAAGPHELIAVIGYGDHEPMTGARRDTVKFVVKKKK